MPITIPDDNNDRALSAVQKQSFLLHAEGQFDLFMARASLTGTYGDMAAALGGLLDGLFDSFLPFLKGAEQNPLNDHHPNSGKGFKNHVGTDVKQIVNWNKWPKATVSDNAQSFYCPSLRRWVEEPDDCPDLWEW